MLDDKNRKIVRVRTFGRGKKYLFFGCVCMLHGLSSCFHCFIRCPHVFAGCCTFLTSQCSTMQFVETDTIQTIYLPSIVTQASLSLGHAAFRAYKRSSSERGWKRYGSYARDTRCPLCIAWKKRDISSLFSVLVTPL